MKYLLIVIIFFSSCISFNEFAEVYTQENNQIYTIYTENGILDRDTVELQLSKVVTHYGASEVFVNDTTVKYVPIFLNYFGEPLLFYNRIDLVDFMYDRNYNYVEIRTIVRGRRIYYTMVFIKNKRTYEIK